MRIDIKAFSLATGLMWGGLMLLMGILNIVFKGYGDGFLRLAESIYPGYNHHEGRRGVAIGALYGFCDGLVGGAILGCLYNLFVCDHQAADE